MGGWPDGFQKMLSFELWPIAEVESIHVIARLQRLGFADLLDWSLFLAGVCENGNPEGRQHYRKPEARATFSRPLRLTSTA